MEEKVIIVDEKNQPIGTATRSQMREKGLRHRATYVIISNSKNEFLIQKRAMSKDVFPGFYDPTTGGVVRENETYEENAIRELKEELGIIDINPTCLFDFLYEKGSYKVWGRAYSMTYDKEIVLEEDGESLTDGEVESFQFMTFKDLKAEIDNGNVMPDGSYAFKKYLKIKKLEI